MAGKKADINADYIIELYHSGKSVAEIAEITGHTRKPVVRILGERGIEIRNPNKRKTLPVSEIVERYASGESMNEIARRFQVSKTTIRLRLKESGVIMRTSAEANQIMMRHRTREENLRNIQSAHNAIRGKTYSHEELCKRAISREKTFHSFGSIYEREIAEEMSKRKIPFIPQKAVDKYNVDFAVFDNIAFEIFGGGWHAYGRHGSRFEQRSKELFRCGYTIVVCWVGFNYAFIPSAIVDYLVSLHQILCSDPSSCGKHYMIRGDAKPSSMGTSNLDYIT